MPVSCTPVRGAFWVGAEQRRKVRTKTRGKKKGAVGHGTTVRSHYTVFSSVTAPPAPFLAGSSREEKKGKKIKRLVIHPEFLHAEEGTV